MEPASRTNASTSRGLRPRIALMWRGDPAAPPPDPQATRFRSIFSALEALGAAAEPVLYADHAVEEVRQRLTACDGVLVWVDPLSDAADRSRLDPLLRDLAARGVWVSAHPDIILKMGVKSVLYRTRELGWGADTHLYETARDFQTSFPARLASSGPRVLKQNRGNGGIGVWKIEQTATGKTADDILVTVVPARSDHALENIRLADFMAECEAVIAPGLPLIDQAFQSRVGDGMVRCYLSQAAVVGFARQYPRSRQREGEGVVTFAIASPKTMFDEAAAEFQSLRRVMESDWVPGLQRILGIETTALPVLWDADFLFGPRTQTGEDSYVLCEINCSSVAPFPETAAPAIARAALARVVATPSSRV